MNLRQIANQATTAINPNLSIQVKRATGYTVAADGLQTPSYTLFTVQGQTQALTSKDLDQISGLNLQGEKLAVYVNGTLLGEVRPDAAGGDVLILPDGSTWLVLQVLENWGRSASWTKVAVVRQPDTAVPIPLDN